MVNPPDTAMASGIQVAIPDVTAADLIIAPSRSNPMVALRIGGQGDVANTHVVWSPSYGPDVPTPVFRWSDQTNHQGRIGLRRI